MGSDVLCQAKSGMGKTAVFVLSILQQIRVENDETTKVAKVGALIMAHTRELAFQVMFDRNWLNLRQPQHLLHRDICRSYFRR